MVYNFTSSLFIANHTSEQESYYSKSAPLKGKLFFLKTNGCVIGLLGKLISCWWTVGDAGKVALLASPEGLKSLLGHQSLRIMGVCVFFQELFWRIHSASCFSL